MAVETRVAVGQIDTYEVVQWLTGPVPTPNRNMDDLPAKLQDALYVALEVKAQQVKKPLVIVSVECGEEPDPKDEHHRWYLHVVASEIITADSRKIRILKD